MNSEKIFNDKWAKRFGRTKGLLVKILGKKFVSVDPSSGEDFSAKVEGVVFRGKTYITDIKTKA